MLGLDANPNPNPNPNPNHHRHTKCARDLQLPRVDITLCAQLTRDLSATAKLLV